MTIVSGTANPIHRKNDGDVALGKAVSNCCKNTKFGGVPT